MSRRRYKPLPEVEKDSARILEENTMPLLHYDFYKNTEYSESTHFEISDEVAFIRIDEFCIVNGVRMLQHRHLYERVYRKSKSSREPELTNFWHLTIYDKYTNPIYESKFGSTTDMIWDIERVYLLLIELKNEFDVYSTMAFGFKDYTWAAVPFTGYSKMKDYVQM